MGAGSWKRTIGGALLLAALSVWVAGCSLHVHPLPGVSVHIPIPDPQGSDKKDHD